MTFTVRPATVEDIPVLVELRALMLQAIGVADTETQAWRDAYVAQLRTQLGTDEVRVTVAVDAATGEIGAGAMVAVTTVAARPDNLSGRIAWLINVATFPQHRGHGMARACCDDVVAWCRTTARVGAIYLNATPMGRGIYEAQGFVETAYPEMRLHLPTQATPE